MTTTPLTRRDILKKGSALSLLSFFGVAAFAQERLHTDAAWDAQPTVPGHGRGLVQAICRVAQVYAYGPAADAMAAGVGSLQTDLAIVSKGKLADIYQLATELDFAVRLLPLANGCCLIAAHGSELVTVYEVEAGGLTNALVEFTGAVFAPSARAVRLLKLDGAGAIVQRMELPQSEPADRSSHVYAQCRWTSDVVKYGRSDFEIPVAGKIHLTKDELICFAIEDLPFLAHAYGPLAGWLVLDSLSQIPGTTTRGIDQARLPTSGQGLIETAKSFMWCIDAHAVDITAAYGGCSRIPVIGSFILHGA